MFKLFISKIKKLLFKEKIFKEEKKRYGNLNSDKIFYVIRRNPKGAGLLSNYSLVLAHLLETKERGLIPIVDYENYDSYYKEEVPINGTKNVWEYYWRQPSEYSLEEVYKSENVILSAYFPSKKNIWWKNMKNIERVRKILKEVSFNNKTKSFLEKQYNDLIPKNKMIIGVKIRGSDYKKGYKGHYIQSNTNEMITLVVSKLNEWKADYIFLATEEEETLEKFKEVFKGKILYYPQERVKKFEKDLLLPSELSQEKNAKYQSGLNYLVDVYILSKCDFLIGNYNGAVNTCLLWNANYKDTCIIDLGVY